MSFKGKNPPSESISPDPAEPIEYPQPRLPGDGSIEEDIFPDRSESGADGNTQAAVQPRKNNVIPFRQVRKRD